MRYFLPTFVFANSFNHQIGPSLVLNLVGCELSFILASTYCCFVGKSAKNLNFKEDGSTGQVWNYIRYPRQLLSSFNVLIKFFFKDPISFSSFLHRGYYMAAGVEKNFIIETTVLYKDVQP